MVISVWGTKSNFIGINPYLHEKEFINNKSYDKLLYIITAF